MSRRAGGRALLALVATLVLTPTTLLGQGTALQEIERMASLGRAEEARAALLSWWEDDRSDASRQDRQHGLWLRGRLTVDPAQASRDFQRLVIEFPGGAYTDQALFRLAQAAYAQGNESGARLHMASLARDYPGSSVRREAEAWMSGVVRAGPPPVFTRAQAPTVEEDTTSAAVDEVAAPEQDSAEVTEPPPVRQPAPAAAAAPSAAADGRYAVQLGAFADRERAASLFTRAQDAGLDARLVRVRGSRLLHVRVGRFDTSADATVFFRSVTDKGFTAAVVRDARDEERVRG